MPDIHPPLEDHRTNEDIKDRILNSLLLEIGREEPGIIGQNIVQYLTLRDLLRQTPDNTVVSDHTALLDLEEPAWTGILPEDDVLRFGLKSARIELGPVALQRLEEKLKKILVSISEYFYVDEEGGTEKAASLPKDIVSHLDKIAMTRTKLDSVYDRVEELIKEITEAHSRLQASLTEVFTKYAPAISRSRSASDDFLASRIETSLIKLSLSHARAHQKLYGHKSSQMTMAQALSTAYAQLKRDEQVIDEQGLAVDRQLKEYETMLELVDGDRGGFALVVEDWMRLQKEEEECKRDLRRLGWIG